MLSAVILSRLSYPAVPLAGQPVHQRSVLPNPLVLGKHLFNVMSRHRGAKPPRRYERSGEISLLSPEYLLSVERWPFHTAPPDH
jgi:hypothetical protein